MSGNVFSTVPGTQEGFNTSMIVLIITLTKEVKGKSEENIPVCVMYFDRSKPLVSGLQGQSPTNLFILA